MGKWASACLWALRPAAGSPVWPFHSVILSFTPFESLLYALRWALLEMELPELWGCHRPGPTGQCIVIRAVAPHSWAVGTPGKIPVPPELRGLGSLSKGE